MRKDVENTHFEPCVSTDHTKMFLLDCMCMYVYMYVCLQPSLILSVPMERDSTNWV